MEAVCAFIGTPGCEEKLAQCEIAPCVLDYVRCTKTALYDFTEPRTKPSCASPGNSPIPRAGDLLSAASFPPRCGAYRMARPRYTRFRRMILQTKY